MRLDLHAQNIKVENNYIDYVGHMGILLVGYGPGTKDVNKNNSIKNNILHHVGQVIWHGHAIFAWQSGENTIANNYIHHGLICVVDVQLYLHGVKGERNKSISLIPYLIRVVPDVCQDDDMVTLGHREGRHLLFLLQLSQVRPV